MKIGINLKLRASKKIDAFNFLNLTKNLHKKNYSKQNSIKGDKYERNRNG